MHIQRRSGATSLPRRKGVPMDLIKYQQVALDKRIYSLRVARRMTQEQLASVLNVSPAAVSKWERNLAVPSVELLWALADYFDCSIDELVGRKSDQIETLGIYDTEKLHLAEIGEELLKCGEISRQEGLLALEAAVSELKAKSAFLAFSVQYLVSAIMSSFMKKEEVEQVFGFLENYVETLPETERKEGHMIAATLKMIFAGASPVILQELIASYIGMEYWQKKGHMAQAQILKCTRQEILDSYKDKKIFSEATGLIEETADLGDFEIQTMLRNMDNATLTAALAGASGKVVTRFFSNLSDRILYFIHEDIEQWNGTEQEIVAAQRKVLELGSFCLGDTCCRISADT